MKQVTVEYRFTRDDAVAASVEVTKCVLRSYYVMPWFGIVMLLFSGMALASGRQSLSDLYMAFMLGMVFALMPFVVRWSAWRNARRLPGLDNLIKWDITESDLRQASDGAEARFSWDKIIKICERKHGFLLFPQPRIAHWLPKHGFQSESAIEAFREIARSKPIPYKGIP